MTRLVLGGGYLGIRAAALWRDQGKSVFVLTRSDDRARRLQDDGYRPLVGDITIPASLPELPQVESVLFAVGWDRSSGKTVHDVYVDGLAHVLEKLPTPQRRFIYISSTGVFGQTAGERVDEDSPCRPPRASGQACLAAEQLLAEHLIGQQTIVLRMAGLYGPGRLPNADRLRAGQPLATSAEALLNLVHVDDAARVIDAAEQHATVPRLYLVADGHPVRRDEFYKYLALRLQVAAPRFDGQSQEGRRTGAGSKHVANDRLLREIPFEFVYPTYRDGLDMIYDAAPSDS